MKQVDDWWGLSYRAAAIRVRLALLRMRAVDIKAGFREDQSRDARGRWDGGRGGSFFTRRDRTGDRKIDSKSEQIESILKDAVDAVGPGSGSAYGVQVHLAVAAEVRRLDLPGIGQYGVEQSFSAGDLVRYGLDGSVRTDIVLRDGRTEAAPIIAVWDLKTGGAKLTPGRVREIRENLGVSDDIPVIELHVNRGISVKCHASQQIY